MGSALSTHFSKSDDASFSDASTTSSFSAPCSPISIKTRSADLPHLIHNIHSMKNASGVNVLFDGVDCDEVFNTVREKIKRDSLKDQANYRKYMAAENAHSRAAQENLNARRSVSAPVNKTIKTSFGYQKASNCISRTLAKVTPASHNSSYSLRAATPPAQTAAISEPEWDPFRADTPVQIVANQSLADSHPRYRSLRTSPSAPRPVGIQYLPAEEVNQAIDDADAVNFFIGKYPAVPPRLAGPVKRYASAPVLTVELPCTEAKTIGISHTQIAQPAPFVGPKTSRHVKTDSIESLYGFYSEMSDDELCQSNRSAAEIAYADIAPIARSSPAALMIDSTSPQDANQVHAIEPIAIGYNSPSLVLAKHDLKSYLCHDAGPLRYYTCSDSPNSPGSLTFSSTSHDSNLSIPDIIVTPDDTLYAPSFDAIKKILCPHSYTQSEGMLNAPAPLAKSKSKSHTSVLSQGNIPPYYNQADFSRASLKYPCSSRGSLTAIAEDTTTSGGEANSTWCGNTHARKNHKSSRRPHKSSQLRLAYGPSTSESFFLERPSRMMMDDRFPAFC